VVELGCYLHHSWGLTPGRESNSLPVDKSEPPPHLMRQASVTPET
jgi:hypothetical protein